jgi:tryptophan synthase alpha chain
MSDAPILKASPFSTRRSTEPARLTAPSAGRIAQKFARLAERGELGLIAYLTAGDPTLDGSERIILAAAEAGADVIEVGVPFSDPVADGPTIQRASERALRCGTTLAHVVEMIGRLRSETEVPFVLFSYFNPILQMGLPKFAAAAAQAGADGVLATDMIPEEAAEYSEHMRAHHLDTIFLAAPTSTDARLAQIARVSTGFLYLISRMGVTGAREALPEDLPALARRVRQFTNLPLAIGFGVSQPEHVSMLGGIADAAVVGSSLVAEVERAANGEAAARAVGERVRLLKKAAREGLSRRNSTP